jgi:hypothetical protein
MPIRQMSAQAQVLRNILMIATDLAWALFFKDDHGPFLEYDDDPASLVNNST